MALKPIDLQVLFSRLNELSREQAVQREFPHHLQAVQTKEMLKQTEQKTHSVNQVSQVEQGKTDAIRSEGQGRGRRSHQGSSKQQDEGLEEEAGSLEVVTDPNLGKKIDISG